MADEHTLSKAHYHYLLTIEHLPLSNLRLQLGAGSWEMHSELSLILIKAGTSREGHKKSEMPGFYTGRSISEFHLRSSGISEFHPRSR